MTPAEEKAIYQKAARYCSYQERTEKEVGEKLRTLGIACEVEATKIIQTLKVERFLSEERYVEAFVRGKFFAKKWGKRKLLTALSQKSLDQVLIQKGLDAINDVDYRQALYALANQRKQQLSGTNLGQNQQKLINYLLQKGYEPGLAWEAVQEVLKA